MSGDDDERQVLALSAKDVDKILKEISIEQFVRNQSETFKTFSAKGKEQEWQSPLRTLIKTQKCSHLFMPSRLNENISIKCVSVPQKSSGNIGLPAIGLLFDDDRFGKTKVIINVDQLTAVRTASGCLAASIVMQPTKTKGKGIIVIFGKGNQAKWHARLFVEYYQLKKVAFVIRNKDELEQQEVQQIKQSLPSVYIDFIQQGSTLMNESLNQADFVCCCTPSTKPLFDWNQVQLKPNVHFSLIGSYQPHMQEVPSQAVERAAEEGALTVDSLESCQKEAGDLLQSSTSSDQWKEIGDLLLQPTNHKDLSIRFSMFKSVGFALQDSAIINLVSQYALENKIGTKVDFF